MVALDWFFMDRKKLVEMLRSISEADTERNGASIQDRTPSIVTASNPYRRYAVLMQEAKALEVFVLLGETEITFRIKSTATVNDLLCVALFILIEKNPASLHAIAGVAPIQHKRGVPPIDKRVDMYERGESTALDRNCSIRHLNRSFEIKEAGEYTSIRLHDMDKSRTETLMLPRGMTVGQLRKERDISMSYTIREGSNPEKDLPDNLPIERDLFIEHRHREDLTLSKNFERTYSVTHKVIGLIPMKTLLKVSPVSISFLKRSFISRKQTYITIALSRVVDVQNRGKKTKIVYTEESFQRKLQFIFHQKEDAHEFSKYCTSLFLSSV